MLYKNTNKRKPRHWKHSNVFLFHTFNFDVFVMSIKLTLSPTENMMQIMVISARRMFCTCYEKLIKEINTMCGFSPSKHVYVGPTWVLFGLWGFQVTMGLPWTSNLRPTWVSHHISCHEFLELLFCFSHVETSHCTAFTVLLRLCLGVLPLWWTRFCQRVLLGLKCTGNVLLDFLWQTCNISDNSYFVCHWLGSNILSCSSSVIWWRDNWDNKVF